MKGEWQRNSNVRLSICMVVGLLILKLYMLDVEDGGALSSLASTRLRSLLLQDDILTIETYQMEERKTSAWILLNVINRDDSDAVHDIINVFYDVQEMFKQEDASRIKFRILMNRPQSQRWVVEWAKFRAQHQLSNARSKAETVELLFPSNGAQGRIQKPWEIWYLPPNDAAQKCIGQPMFVDKQVFSTNCVQYRGNSSRMSLLQFVNEKGGFFRHSNGTLMDLGRRIQQVESNTFKVTDSLQNDVRGRRPLHFVHACPRIKASELSKDAFIQQFVFKHRPVVIEDAMTNWTALHRWTNEYMLEAIGKRRVHVKLSPDGNFEGCEPLEWWNDTTTTPAKDIPVHVLTQLESPHKVLVRPATMEMLFEEFVSKLKENSTSKTSYYLEYLSMASYVPELMHDAPAFNFANDLVLSHKNLWFGDGKTIGKLHFDPYENLLGMISGEKVFMLIDPSNNTRLHEGHIREAKLSYDFMQDKFSRTTLTESTSMVNTPIDIAGQFDNVEYPAFVNVSIMHCSVKAGETLYLPPFWWHEVKSSPDPVQHRNVAVNFWYQPFLDKPFPCKTCKLSVNKLYHPLLQKMNMPLLKEQEPFASNTD